MKKILSLFSIAFILLACNPKQSALNSLERFTNRMEQKSDSWSEADWDDAAQQYDEITQTLKRYDYSEEELKYIGRLEGRCMAYFMEHYTNTAVDRFKDATNELEGVFDGFFDVLGN